MPDPTRAYLSLGSNLGDRLENLAAAVRRLCADVSVTEVSPVYETAPLGADGSIVDDQDPYLNCIVAVRTSLSASGLHAVTSRIESEQGRERIARWRPRPIDIDIVLFGDERIVTPALTVPHPRMHERAFVLRPLVDLDPGVRVPGAGRAARLLPKLEWQDVRLHTSAGAFAAAIGPAVAGGVSPRRSPG